MSKHHIHRLAQIAKALLESTPDSADYIALRVHPAEFAELKEEMKRMQRRAGVDEVPDGVARLSIYGLPVFADASVPRL